MNSIHDAYGMHRAHGGAQPLRSLLLDFNSYFASVEQELNPALRGCAVAILPVMAESSCCIAASYEAKQRGVKTGTSVREARRLCPHIVFIEARHAVYVEFHHRAVAAIDEIAPIRQVLSIDEVECELTGRWREREAALAIARALKAQIQHKVGASMGTSIGIAPNTLLAKLASNMQKPNGLTLLEHPDIPFAFLHLPPGAINGIGSRMAARLAHCGIHTMHDLYSAPASVLRTVWGGKMGLEMYDMLRGLPYAPRQSERQSIGHSHVLPPTMRNLADAIQVLHRLLQKAAMRLRKYNMYCTHLGLQLRIGSMSRAPSHGNSPAAVPARHLRRIECAAGFCETQDTAFLLHAIEQLWTKVHAHYAQYAISPATHPPYAVGLVLSGLVPATQHTPSLFEYLEPFAWNHQAQNATKPIGIVETTLPLTQTGPIFSQARSERRHRLFKTIDHINIRYGKNALHFASSHKALHHAPMRIAFSQIPDLETER